MDIERLEKLREEIEQYRAVADDRCMSTNYEDDLLALIDEAIARQSVTSEETETTSCEWCEIASACEYEVTFFKDDDRWATERSLLPKYCPNCGRSLS